jgi:protein-S-isoprenylcysteine O-methyltransferase Ste14
MTRIYAVASYLAFLATLIYFVGWLADIGVPKGLSIFALQHSAMARPWFKRATRSVIPQAGERATYVLLSSAVVAAIATWWRPLDHELWNVGSTPWRSLLWVGYATGWVIVVSSTVMIGHFDLFGLAQAVRGDRYQEPRFATPGLYAIVRHPIMSGFIVAFWVTPRMTDGHLVFAAVSTAYIVIAVRLEERDLRAQLGRDYERYAQEVPRFVPVPMHRRP